MAIMQNIVAFEIGKAYCTEVFGSVFFFKIFYYILWNCIIVLHLISVVNTNMLRHEENQKSALDIQGAQLANHT